MSRVGKKPINIPSGVTVTVDGRVFRAKSPKGELSVPFSEKMNVKMEGSEVTITPVSEDNKLAAIWGLTRALIQNAVTGVDTGWEKILELYGVGYRAQMKGNALDLQVGQSHPIVIDPPSGISFETSVEAIEGQNVQIIKVKGISRQLVGDVSAKIRDLKPPEPYKGKGIRYRGEYVRRKAGKATGK